MALVPLFARTESLATQASSTEILVLGPRRTRWITGSAFRISFRLNWQMDNGIFYRLIMVMERNKNFDAVSQTDLTRVQFRLYRRLSYPVRAIFPYISVQNLSNHEQEKQNVCRARRVTFLWRSWINVSPCKHSGPPSRVKAQTRHSAYAQAPLARRREGKSLRGEAGWGGGGGGVALLLEDIFPGFPSKIGELLITYSFLLSKLSGFTVNQCFKAKIIFFPLMISFHGLRDSFFLNIIVIGSLTNLRLSCCLSHNFMIWLQ